MISADCNRSTPKPGAPPASVVTMATTKIQRPPHQSEWRIRGNEDRVAAVVNTDSNIITG